MKDNIQCDLEDLSVNEGKCSNLRIDYPRIPVHRVWLMARVQQFREKEVCDSLMRMGMETFLPFRKEYYQWNNCIKRLDRLIFPMVIFIHLNCYECSKVVNLSIIYELAGMLKEYEPIIISDLKITKLRFMCKNSSECICVADDFIKGGQSARVIKGPLKGFEGELTVIHSKTKIGIYIDTIGYIYVNMPVEYVANVNVADGVAYEAE